MKDLTEAGWDGSMDVKMDDLTDADIEQILDDFADDQTKEIVMESTTKKVFSLMINFEKTFLFFFNLMHIIFNLSSRRYTNPQDSVASQKKPWL